MKEFELEPGEHVVSEVRKHWFIFLVQLLPFAILALVPYLIPKLVMLSHQPTLVAIPWDDPLVRVAKAVWLLFVWTGAFIFFTRFYLNLWVLTNLRIVDIHQKGFFRREVSSLLLNRVQDITIDSEGVMVSILDIGDINVQSAGAIDRFYMRGIPHPATLRDIILKYIPNQTTPGL